MMYRYDYYKLSCKVYVCSKDLFLESGVLNLAKDYFIAIDKELYVIDASVFRSLPNLVKHLQFIKNIKPYLLVLVVLPVGGNKSISKLYTSFLTVNSPIRSWVNSIDSMNFMTPNIDHILSVLKESILCEKCLVS